MFSLIFGGRLGDFLAPRPRTHKEIWTFLKSGLFDKALFALSKPNHGFDVNEHDLESGMAPLHYASAAGKLDLMAELLAQGADIRLTDCNGNSALHFAAKNDQKAAIEILLRSGADPTVPNEAGALPVELSESAMVKELFIRDPTNIFSPMAQARALFHDYVTQLHDDLHHPAAKPQLSELSEKTDPVVNLTSEFEAETLHVVPESPSLPSQASSTSPPSMAASDEMALSTVIANGICSPAPRTPSPQRDPVGVGATAVVTPPRRSIRIEDGFATPAFLEPVELQQDSHEVQLQVLDAARETAALSLLTSEERQIRFDMAKICQRLSSAQEVQRLLRYDPRLAMCRLSGLGALCVDGQTPMHLAARFGNLPALKIFLEAGEGVSVWVRDLQGRTPLHVCAAAATKAPASTAAAMQQTMDFLVSQMYTERGIEPLGANAPTDLAGMTPLGVAKAEVRGRVGMAMEKALFSPGDKSILPHTPMERRTGKSPWKAPLSFYSSTSKDNVIYAFGEAQGWTVNMEDRHCISCPVPNRPAWSLFAVFDGHGGAFCSNFLATHFAEIVAQAATDLDREMGSSFLPGGTANDSDVTPEVLTDLLLRACIKADDSLSLQPRMKVETRNGGKKLVVLDRSGSTGIIVLVTSQFVATANVGDSRAIMALRAFDAPSQSELVSSPFAASSYVREVLEGEERVREDSGSASVSRGPQAPAHTRRRSSTCALVTHELSRDHKPCLPEERTRIEAAGAEIHAVETPAGQPHVWEIACPRMDGVRLRMSRAFGDFYLKQNSALPASDQAVIAVPEVRVVTRSSSDAFIVLACDGVWDVMSNQDAVEFVADRLGFTAYGGPPGGVTTAAAARACDDLVAHCLELGSTDNLTVIVIAPGPPPTLPPSTPGEAHRSAQYHHHAGSIGTSSARRSFSGTMGLGLSPSPTASSDSVVSQPTLRVARSRPSISVLASTEIDLPTLVTKSLCEDGVDQLHKQGVEFDSPTRADSDVSIMHGLSTPGVPAAHRKGSIMAQLFGNVDDANDEGDLSKPC